MASLLSVNGTLKSLYHEPEVEEDRSIGYKAVEIGEPLVVRYLHISTKHETDEKVNQLMISTFVKTAEEKQSASEAINYFNPKITFENNIHHLTDFGAQVYGHELCYYSKSYLGESIRLTTKIMELDKVDQKLVKNIQDVISTVSGIPAFTEFLPYTAVAKSGVSIISKLINYFNPDDEIEYGYNLDLHFHRNNAKCLQSGRIVCVPKKSDDEIEGKYELTKENKLVDIQTKQEYTESTYYVLQINNEKNSLYEDFDYFQQAADLLRKTNRGDPAQITNSITSIVKGYGDITAMQKIEDLSLEINEDSKKKINALYKSMTSETKRLFQSRVKEILKPE